MQIGHVTRKLAAGACRRVVIFDRRRKENHRLFVDYTVIILIGGLAKVGVIRYLVG